MKMKEVTEKTNLTERAVRLYIENGLITPSFNESYSGRRNIDFSSDDVEKLKRISVLRKAGFSIAQIKLMQSEPEKCKEVLERFIDKTKRRIETDGEILSCITPLLSCEKLDIEQISLSLDQPVMNEKELPAEDSEIPLKQKSVRILFMSLGVVGFVVAAVCFAMQLRVEIPDIGEYLYPRYNVIYILLYLTTLFVPVMIVLLNRKKKICSDKRNIIKTFICTALLGVYSFCTFFTFCLAVISCYSNPESLVVSHTRNEKNYMVFDADGAEEVLSEFLPEELPEAENLKYEYYYKEYGVSHEPPLTRVFIEIPLDKISFSQTVEYYKEFQPSDSTCEPREEKKREWTVVYYREEYERPPTNYTPIFAYNEKESKVRLMCEYGRDSIKGASDWTGIYKW